MAIQPITLTRHITYFVFVPAMTVLCLGCGGESTPITSQTSKYQVAEDTSAPNNSSATPGAPGGADFAAGQQTGGTNDSRTGSAAIPAGGQDDSQPLRTSPPPKPSTQPPGSGTSRAPTAADGPDKLLAHIDTLQNQDPRGATREESLGNLVKIQREIVQTADKVLAANSGEDTQVRAAEAKVRALSLLSQLEKDAQTEMKHFVAELKKSPHPKLGRLAQRMDFAQQMDAFNSSETKDGAKLLADFKQLFAQEEKDESLFRLSQQVTEFFLQARQPDQAAEIMKMVADAFGNHSNPNLVKAAKMIREQMLVLELHLEDKFGAVLEGKPKADEEFLAAIDKLLAGPELGEMTLQMVAQMAQMLERQKADLAGQMYAKLADGFSKRSTPELAKTVETMAANFAKRKAIIGRPFTVEGVMLDGQPFDWGKYQGKVVLVDFWATWCQPCLAEIPNIKQNYDRYRDQGFEVVGINLDDDPETVQKFFARQRIPWPTLMSPDPQKVGFEHPLAVKCGVEAIPFLVLVDRDGKAIELNLRGEELGQKLATMFPNADKSDPAAAPNPLRESGTGSASEKAPADKNEKAAADKKK